MHGEYGVDDKAITNVTPTGGVTRSQVFTETTLQYG